MPLAIMLFATITVLFFLALYRIFSTMKDAWLKGMAAGLMAVILIAEIAIITLFKGIFPPAVDGGHIYSDALYLLKHGNLLQNAYYLQVYPNNVAITVIRYWLYRYVAFGNPSAFMLVDKITAAIFLNVGIYFSWKLIVRLFSMKMANVFLVMTLACLPLFLYIAYFYTDTVAILFLSALLVYLWYLYDKTKKPLYMILMGLLLAAGCEVREDLILFLPAMIIYMFFVLKWKKRC
ncbi:glycosyltransferase family 39 protein [Terrilactibacillus sp. S3-3]|nr:glycosyltransferase family 39 protein [Terrilactibacillus sp. S3-3]